MSAPAFYLVAERRDGVWLVGDDWSSRHSTAGKAEACAESLRASMERWGRSGDDIGVFACVPVDGAP